MFEVRSLLVKVVNWLSEVRMLAAKAVHSMCEHRSFIVSLIIYCAKLVH